MAERDAFVDLPILDELGDDLETAFLREERHDAEEGRRRAAGRRLLRTAPARVWQGRGRSRLARRSTPSIVLAALLALLAAATAATATALVLRAGVVAVPDPGVVPPELTPERGTARVAAPRSADPAGGPLWAVRVSRSQAGLVCATVGQVRERTFGLVGMDGRFRRLPTVLVDGCGQAGPGAASLVGARVVAAEEPAAVRTIVYGVGGAGLAAATLVSTQGRENLPLSDQGAFVAALPGYPEDRAIRLRLRFAGGRTERHDLGVSPGVSPDPRGGQAWSAERFVLGTRLVCANFFTARRTPDGGVQGPSACARREGERDWFADARRLGPGDRGVPGFDRWTWRGHPPRTVVWGAALPGIELRSVTLLGAGAPQTLTPSEEGAFLAVLPAGVDPGALRLEVRLAGGRVERERRGRGLTPDLVPSRRPR